MMLKKNNKVPPETVESFIATLPDNAEATFRGIYRRGGRLARYELKYVQYDNYNRRATERYIYVGDTPLDCIVKLRKKQAHPECRVDCTCHYRRQDDE